MVILLTGLFYLNITCNNNNPTLPDPSDLLSPLFLQLVWKIVGCTTPMFFVSTQMPQIQQAPNKCWEILFSSTAFLGFIFDSYLWLYQREHQSRALVLTLERRNSNWFILTQHLSTHHLFMEEASFCGFRVWGSPKSQQAICPIFSS